MPCGRNERQISTSLLVAGQNFAKMTAFNDPRRIEHGIGVAEEHAYRIKKIDSDYFDERES